MTVTAHTGDIANTFPCRYPPVPIGLPRVTPDEGLEIDGQYVPGGVGVSAHHFATYRMPGHFRDAYEFHPERWLEDPKYQDDDLSAVEPFVRLPTRTPPLACLKHLLTLMPFALDRAWDLATA
jgi:hypothetical protein